MKRSNAMAMDKNRIDALTDGVYAIALTLLVLDIKLPAGYSPRKSLHT